MSEDFDMVETPQELALRPRTQVQPGDRAIVEIHPVRSSYAFIVSVQPPQSPEFGLKRVSCDIVLVIDVSGSMSAAAPLPGPEDDNDREATGLSVLDLVKHAARTILETLGPGDRLGIVTFSDDATVRTHAMIFPHTTNTKRYRWYRNSRSCLQTRRTRHD